MFNEISFYLSFRRKKKSPSGIIQASFFRKTPEIKPIPITEKSNNNTSPVKPKTETTSLNTESKTVPQILTKERPINSALSLKSIQQKRIFEQQKRKVIITDTENLPVTPFTQEELLQYWNAYGKKMDKKGERIIGSMFAMNKPVLQPNHKLLLVLPNETMRIDVENISKPLLTYLHQELNNFDIELTIDVNEEVAVKHAFTPQDKYDKLKEQNPLIDKLRSLLDLDL